MAGCHSQTEQPDIKTNKNTISRLLDREIALIFIRTRFLTPIPLQVYSLGLKNHLRYSLS